MPQSHGPIRRVCIHLVPVNFQAARSCRPPCAELSRAKVTNSLVVREVSAPYVGC
ncbi:unnamed protein product [Schistosoma mattheei]|uniref:Uncharacterized protein n=1 Tax=Schistosoma mattheei TaxID=31246 RepID=A0A183PYI0_9TREM|nr:unnamed protein product [Schistosoma mattheei]